MTEVDEILTKGQKYKNGSSEFEYLGADWVKNTKSGWTCMVHNVTIEPDGSIVWGWSSGGFFEKY